MMEPMTRDSGDAVNDNNVYSTFTNVQCRTKSSLQYLLKGAAGIGLCSKQHRYEVTVVTSTESACFHARYHSTHGIRVVHVWCGIYPTTLYCCK